MIFFTIGLKHCNWLPNIHYRYLNTAYCESEIATVCQTKPLYAEPDYECPDNFIPYMDQCINADPRTLKYKDAMVSHSIF